MHNSPIPNPTSLAHIILLSDEEKRLFNYLTNNPGFQFVSKVGYGTLPKINFMRGSHQVPIQPEKLSSELQTSLTNIQAAAAKFCADSEISPICSTSANGQRYSTVYQLKTQRRLITKEHIPQLRQLILCSHNIHCKIHYDNVSVSTNDKL